jgi:hypothetical protein
MSVNFSNSARAVIQAISANERPISLFEIEHAMLSTPIRLAENTEDVLSNGKLFMACAVRFTYPDDQEKSQPRASLAFDNISRHMSRILEQTNGAMGASLIVRQVMPSSPDIYERAQLRLKITSVSLSASTLSVELSYRETLNLASIPITYRNDVAPGIF